MTIDYDTPASQGGESSATGSIDDAEISTTVSADNVDTFGDSIVSADDTKTEVAIDIPDNSTSIPAIGATRSTTKSSNSVNAHSNSSDHPSESIPSDDFSHQSPSIVSDEFFLQCVFCFNEFEKTDANGTCLEPCIITPCGHRFHIECLKKDCELILKKKKEVTFSHIGEQSNPLEHSSTTRPPSTARPQNEEERSRRREKEFLMQCPHPFCKENLTKSWALEKGLIRIEDIQNENHKNENEVLEELNQRLLRQWIANRRRIEFGDPNRENSTQNRGDSTQNRQENGEDALCCCLRNWNICRRVFHLFFCILALALIGILVSMVVACCKWTRR